MSDQQAYTRTNCLLQRILLPSVEAVYVYRIVALYFMNEIKKNSLAAYMLKQTKK